MTPEIFIQTLLPYAQAAEQKYKVPALSALAQTALETGWGKSAPGNMYFGMKAGKSYTGKKQLLTTKEVHNTETVKYPVVISITKRADGKFLYTVKDYFRAYDSPAQSFEDYAHMLSVNPRYAKAFQFTDPILFSKEIAAGGYATATNYFDSLKSIIDLIKKKANSLAMEL